MVKFGLVLLILLVVVINGCGFFTPPLPVDCVAVDEICGNGVDEDCDGEDLECPVVTGDAWYVDNAATGNGDGTSWTNAATSLVALDWSQINGGDTVYISGGTTSKTYDKQILVNKIISDGIVTITKGINAGHNGEVIFQQSGTAFSPYGAIGISSSENIKLSGITFSNKANNNIYAQQSLKIGHSKNIIIDNCHIVSNGNGVGVSIGYSENITLTNNLIETLENDLEWGQDGIGIGAGNGGHTIVGNTIILRGTNIVPHKDLIQMGGNEGLNSNLETTIADNFFYYNSPNALSSSAVMYFAGVGSNKFSVHDNIIAAHTTGISGLVIYPSSTNYDVSANVFDNIFVLGGSKDDGIAIGDIDSLTMKNNVVVVTGEGDPQAALQHFIKSGLNAIPYKDIDNNHYYKKGGDVRIFTGSSTVNWDQWQALGYDVHGSNSEIKFKNIWGTNREDYEIITDSCVPSTEICGNDVDEDCDGEDLACPVDPCDSVNCWYISTESSGTASGNSWVNARNMKDFTESFYSSRVMPGDIIYIDGGIDNKSYSFEENANGKNFATFFWTKSGTADKKITITRGVDQGHDGAPIFNINNNNAFYFSYSNYVEVSNLVIAPKAEDSHVTGIIVEDCNFFDIFNNDIDWTYGFGVLGEHDNFIRIMNNSFKSQRLSGDELLAVSVDVQEDPIKIGSSYGMEIAYNYIQARTPVDRSYNPSRDIFQLPYTNQNSLSEPVRIHHNFISMDFNNHPSTTDLLTVQNSGGNILFYNNIVNVNNAASLLFQMSKSAPNLSLEAYNNIFILSEGPFKYKASMWFRSIDSITFKNNLVRYEEYPFVTMADDIRPEMDFDYNVYDSDYMGNFFDGAGTQDISYSAWQSRGQDLHSITEKFDLLNSLSLNTEDYNFELGSIGIDDGILIPLVEDDFVGTLRPQGSGWDVGAFER